MELELDFVDDVKLHPLQQEIYNSTARFRTVITGRRFGKSTLAIRVAKRHVLGRANQNVWYVLPTYSMLHEIWDVALGLFKKRLIVKISKEFREITLANGSKLRFRTADRPDLLRGSGIDLLIIDEASWVGEDALRVLMPALMDNEGSLLVTTTPPYSGKGHWTFRYFQWGADPSKPEYVSWNAPSISNPHLSENEIQRLKEELSSEEFRVEVLGEYVDSDLSVFKIDNACYVRELKELVPPFYMGVDYGGKYDLHAIAVLDSIGQLIHTWAGMTDDWSSIWARVRKLYEQYGDCHVAHDVTTAGAPSHEFLLQHIPSSRLTGIKFNNTVIKDMVHSLQHSVESGLISIVEKDHRELLTQMANFRRYTTPKGDLRYGNPKSSRNHDDLVCALYMANYIRPKKGRRVAVGGMGGEIGSQRSVSDRSVQRVFPRGDRRNSRFWG